MRPKAWIGLAVLLGLLTLASTTGFVAGAHWEAHRRPAVAPPQALAQAPPPAAPVPAPLAPAANAAPAPPAEEPGVTTDELLNRLREIGKIAASDDAPVPARPPLQIGQAVILRTPEGNGVWLALTDAGWYAMLDAQNADDRAALRRLSSEGAVIRVRENYPATVAELRFASVLVRLSDGHKGWVQRELVKAQP